MEKMTRWKARAVANTSVLGLRDREIREDMLVWGYDAKDARERAFHMLIKEFPVYECGGSSSGAVKLACSVWIEVEPEDSA